MLRKLLSAAAVSTLLLAGTLSAAHAADMGMPYKAPPPPAPSWTGCYVSAGYGYGFWDQYQHEETLPGGVALSADVDSGGRGWLGRFGGGCDYQFTLGNLGNFVVGALADYDWMNIHGQMSPGDTSYVGNEKESGAWYAGGRVGYVVAPNLLTYFDAGYTETHFDHITFNGLAAPFTPGVTQMPSNTYHGWFVGGGTEYALTFNWLPIHGLFWRNEWRYASYDVTDLPILTPAGAPTGIGMHADKDVQTITSSLVWRFNWSH